MTKKLLAIISVAALASFAAPAKASTIAGWDFSQYVGDGFLSIDGSTFTDTLNANYSNFDLTGNAGAESAAFGTMYIDGSFGSTAVPVGTGTEEIVPTGGSLVSNLDAPVEGLGDNPFDSHTVLAGEGQTFTSFLAMTALAAVDVVFEADISSVGTAMDWVLTLGGKTFSGTSDIEVAFSTDGTTYASVGTIGLTAVEGPKSLSLATGPSDKGYVKLSLTAASGQPIIDNVAIEASVTVNISKEDGKCVDAINKGAGKVSKAQSADHAACIKDKGKGKVADAEVCIRSDPKGKVSKAVSKIKDSECAGVVWVLPTLEQASAEVGNIMVRRDIDLIHTIYGGDLDAVLVDAAVDKDGAKCQASIAKAVGKCQDTKLKEFRGCKKNALKGKPALPANALELQDACMGVDTAGQPDPKGKIAKKCATGLPGAVSKSCGGLDTDALFPGCAGQTLGPCLDQKVECAVCLTLNELDGLKRDCDLFDDGTDNGSCS
jgi:hypothetical protein